MDLRWLIMEMTFHLCIKNVKITILLKSLHVLINIINLRIIHKFWEIIFCIENSQLCHAVFHHAYVLNSGPRGHLDAVLIHVGYHLQGRHILDSENHQLFSCSAYCKTILKYHHDKAKWTFSTKQSWMTILGYHLMLEQSSTEHSPRGVHMALNIRILL